MFNLMKRKQVYPDIFQLSNISSFWKSKGSKDDMNNQRGVFNCVKIRTILDKLIIKDMYELLKHRSKKGEKQAGAELCQAQVQLC